MPPWSSTLFVFHSPRTCGSRAHRLPPAANSGMPADESDCGLTGAKIIQSCPATRLPLAQSRRAFASRSRNTPMLSPMPTAG